MRSCRIRAIQGVPLLGALAAAIALAPGPARAVAAAGGHCASRATIAPVRGSAGEFRIGTPRGTTTARWPAAPEGAVPPYLIRALDQTWDADGNPATVEDTLVIAVGSTVRWVLASGIHTLTSGKNSSDPLSGVHFDYLLDDAHPAFDSTFSQPDTVEFFCFFHEPVMSGVVIVSENASVPGDPLPHALTFSRPPVPNPSRGTIGFAIALPRERQVEIEVLDVTGRQVASLHRGPLAAGEHPFRWRGRSDSGDLAPTGIYVIHLRSGEVSATRRVSLLR